MATEYDKLPIPDDWDKETNGYKLWFICVPNSSKWTSLFKSVVYELTRGRAYNINSGYVIGARDTGKEIFFSMQSCDLNTIARLLRQGIAAIVGEQVDLTDEAQVYPDNVDYRSVSSLPGLVPTLQALNLSPTTNITNRIDTGCGCGCEPGTEDPPTQGVEGDPPPDGWTTPVDPETGQPIETGSPTYNVRKCKAASLLHDEMRGLFNQLNIYGVDTLIGLGSSLVIGVITTIISAQFTGPLAIFIGVISAVATFVFAFTSEAFNLSTLIGLLDTHRAALICALYSAQNADSAIQSYTDILDAEGASFGMILSIEGVLTYATANTLFFQKDDATGDTVEDTINNYQGEDCSSCGITLNLITGSLTSGALLADGNPFTIDCALVQPGSCPDHGYIDLLASNSVDVVLTFSGMVRNANYTCYPHFLKLQFGDGTPEEDIVEIPSSPVVRSNITHIFGFVTDPNSGSQSVTIIATSPGA